MIRQFIYNDLGEFGFNEFHICKDNKWTWLDLEVDCDPITIKNFIENPELVFQFWINDKQNKICLASNFMGYKRQVNIPISMLKKLQVTFTAPARGGGEFDLSINSEKYRGEIISGKINVKMNDNNWNFQDYQIKRKQLEKIIDVMLELGRSTLTKTTEYINA